MDADADGQHGGVVQVDGDGGTGRDVNAASVLTAAITGNQGRQAVDLPDLTGGVIERRVCLGQTSVSRREIVACWHTWKRSGARRLTPANVKYAVSG